MLARSTARVGALLKRPALTGFAMALAAATIIGGAAFDPATTVDVSAKPAFDSPELAEARATIHGGRLRPAAVSALPAVTRDMSDNMFRAVVNAAVTVAGTDHLAKPFRSLNKAKLAKEQYCMAQAIYYEARGETAMGQLAVAEVVLNRMADRRYPSSVCGVVFQGATKPGCQFSFACDGQSDKPNNASAWKAADALARYVMLDVKWDRLTGTATHYHADYVSPYWAPALQKITTVGKHVFYRWMQRGETHVQES